MVQKVTLPPPYVATSVILLYTTCPISLRAFYLHYLHVSFKNFKNKTEYNGTYMSCFQASSASSGRVEGVGGGGARNMKSMRLPLAAIFL